MAKILSVRVRQSQVRRQPSFLGAVVTTVNYGDQLTVLQERESWIEVRSERGEGWIHGSALTSKTIRINPLAGQVEPGTVEDEVAIAGKAFNTDVEQMLARSEEGSTDELKQLAAMENIRIPMSEVVAFLRDGDLRGVEER